ncbi:MAG: primosomal protein N' [Prevotella sp.]|nr:primosomal protein N' [Prevotella sp.]
MRYVDLMLPVPLEGFFTYSVPERLRERMQFGVRVIVTFGPKKTYVGIVVRTHDNTPEGGYKIKEIIDIVDDKPMMLDKQMKLWQWIAEYYLAPIGDVYKAAMPSGLKQEEGFKPKTETYIRLTEKYRNVAALHVAINMLCRAEKQLAAFLGYLQLSHWDEVERGVAIKEITRDELMNATHSTLPTLTQLTKRGMLETYEKEVGRLNHSDEPHPENIQKLSTAQQDAYNEVLFSMMRKNVTLLHGVTSSGKTEIYIHLIQHALDEGKQVLYLLPEIALTVQIMDRLQKVFGRRLGIYHSKYSDGERVEIWQKQMSKDPYDIILGARSAVFLPFQNLGLVIIDEEHETSFKQQDPAPRYHARSAAIVLASMYGAKTLLGTATPSIESYYNAKTGKYGYVALTQRYEGIELPEFRIVDIKDLQHRKMMTGPFSPMLLAEVRKALEEGKQAILFQNRRGFAPMIECKQCGWVPHCQHCDVSLTLHRNTNQLTCHYCGYTYSIPTKCPNCEGTELRTRGFGTEKIEDAIRDIFPEARVARMDLDTTKTRNAYERIITDFATGRTNILIGTQMISKGLDFANVSVVGILNADSMLNFPDFRAYEHAFMMMAQVGGRAGRKGKRGLVILQTKSPELPIVQQVVNNDYEAMYVGVTAERREFHYPPYYRLVYVYLKHRDDKVVASAAATLSFKLRIWFGERVLGPDKPSVAKVKSLNIRKIMIKLENGIDIQKVRQYLRKAHSDILKDKRFNSLVIYYDVDPL